MDDLLLYKFLQNKASEREVANVLDWLDADPDHVAYLDSLDNVLNAMVLAGLPAAVCRSRVNVVRWRRIAAWGLRVAAVLTVCLGLSYLFASQMFERRARRVMSISVPDGERIRMTLADGTAVWLNSGTTLEYPAVFAGGERRVKVSGEAMFDVKHDVEHPFVVETFACDIEVLGTKFNVEADEIRGIFETDLLRGQVKVVDRVNGKQVLMRPNQSVQLVAGRLCLGEQKDADRLLWTDGILSITDMTFEQVMAKFERCYDVRIVINRDELPHIRFRRCKIRISDGVDHALEVLRNAADFNYRRDISSNTIVIE